MKILENLIQKKNGRELDRDLYPDAPRTNQEAMAAIAPTPIPSAPAIQQAKPVVNSPDEQERKLIYSPTEQVKGWTIVIAAAVISALTGHLWTVNHYNTRPSGLSSLLVTEAENSETAIKFSNLIYRISLKDNFTDEEKLLITEGVTSAIRGLNEFTINSEQLKDREKMGIAPDSQRGQLASQSEKEDAVKNVSDKPNYNRVSLNTPVNPETGEEN